MPFLTLEYSANLAPFDATAALRRLNQAIVDAGFAQEVVIKARAVRFDDFQVGTSDDVRGFAHIKLSVMPGRTEDVKKALAERLMTTLRDGLPVPGLVQLAVEIRDLDKAGFLSTRLGE